MFDGIYCWNTTFGYFEEDKNLLVAQHIFRLCDPAGCSCSTSSTVTSW